MANANIIFNSEAAKRKFSFSSLAARLDSYGAKVNPARKPWQEIFQFLYQFSSPHEPKLIFSMLDGLSSVSQAALHLGYFDVVAFEQDKRIWEEAGEVVAEEIKKLKARETLYRSQLIKNWPRKFIRELNQTWMKRR